MSKASITASAASTSEPQPCLAVSLADLQTSLGAYILHGPDAAMHPAENAMHPIEHAIADQGGLPVRDRLGIYHTAYRLRLLGVLRDHFEQTHVYMGDAFFDQQALAYIEAHPPEHDNLRHYGQSWPQWLARSHPHDTDMADLSRFEWALRHAFDATDAPALSMLDLAAIDPAAWETLGFELAAGSQVLALGHAVIPLWQALSEGQAPAPVEAAPHWLVVWRKGWQPHFRSIDAPEAQALSRLLAGQSFTQACEVLADTPEPEAVAGQWLHTWVSDALLSRVVAPS